VNDALKSEKQLRDKLQRERDELAAEKYTADQELKVSRICHLAMQLDWIHCRSLQSGTIDTDFELYSLVILCG